jgi:ribosome-associated protein
MYDLDLSKEIVYQFSRSGGKGGQHVNKVETKVQLRFNILKSDLLSTEAKEKLVHVLQNKINKEGELVMSNQTTRSHLKNKDLVTKQFYNTFSAALKPGKKRMKTNLPASVKRKRLDDKKRMSIKKNLRRKDFSGE